MARLGILDSGSGIRGWGFLAALIVTFAQPVGAQQPPRASELPRTVTMTLAEYNRLIDLANQPPSRSTGAPVAAVLGSADLRVRIERETARGVFTLAGNVLRDGVNRVHVLTGGTLVDASAAGRPVPLIADANAHLALLPGPGPFSLALEWGGPLKFAPGRASFVLPVPPAGTARATIDLPGELADVRLSAGLITRRSAAGGRTIVEATLDPGSATEVWWSMRDSAPVAAVREVRMLTDVMTLVTVGDSDVKMVALVDLTVVQGEPRSVDVQMPAGYEVVSVTSNSLEAGARLEGGLMLTIADPTVRRHQLLISLERQLGSGSFPLDTGFVTLPGVQRERGDIAIEGIGTLELTATEREGMHRIDVRELKPALQALARFPVLMAFRYQRGPVPLAPLAIEVKRFDDVAVLAAVADRAVVTTLVTSEGRALTEIRLQMQNRAQSFVKVALPQGAAIVSVEVAGVTAKPVVGADGTRVPLFRPGVRPKGSYPVSFVYQHAGRPFDRRGDLTMSLPVMDIPIGILEWELFVPSNYSVRVIDGNMINRSVVEKTLHTGGDGVGSGLAGGTAGGVAETITVAGETPDRGPSQNVINLQQRAAGVLPIPVDVPRAGTSHQFVKPLVVDQEAVVILRYERK
jgi:hypothetical protein